MNILAPRNHGSGNMETDIPERKPPLIGLITIHKKIERMSSPEPLYIGQISYYRTVWTSKPEYSLWAAKY